MKTTWLTEQNFFHKHGYLLDDIRVNNYGFWAVQQVADRDLDEQRGLEKSIRHSRACLQEKKAIVRKSFISKSRINIKL